MTKKPVKVTQETDTGRNTHFKDVTTGVSMTRAQFVNAIEAGKYPNYHVREVNGVKTPVSNPDGKEKNNLG